MVLLILFHRIIKFGDFIFKVGVVRYSIVGPCTVHEGSLLFNRIAIMELHMRVMYMEAYFMHIHI